MTGNNKYKCPQCGGFDLERVGEIELECQSCKLVASYGIFEEEYLK